MKLKGFHSLEIRYLKELAKIQERENEPVKIKLFIKNGEDIKTVKSDLEKRYKVKSMKTYDFLSKKGEDILMFADVPVKNLSKVLKREYVNNYGWPETLEVLSEKHPSLGFPTRPLVPDTIEFLNEPKIEPDKVVDLTRDETPSEIKRIIEENTRRD
jgi:hypothetical protein